jgi:biopolymer transport protein ExbB
MLTDTPSRTERVQQGGPVGAVIIILGALAALIGLWRWGVILVTSRKVAAQRKTSDVDRGNPLGRILAVYQESRDSGTETLELKLDEAVLRESSKIEQFLWLVKTVSVIAPLLGLLGTVTGMIQTFQAITLFGAGDPKMMAGGISEALVTTMLGLMTAIPLVLLHATLSNSTRRISDVLEEQSAGLVATHSEMIDAGT